MSVEAIKTEIERVMAHIKWASDVHEQYDARTANVCLAALQLALAYAQYEEARHTEHAGSPYEVVEENLDHARAHLAVVLEGK